MKRYTISLIILSFSFLLACSEIVESPQDDCKEFAQLNFSNYDSLKTDPLSVQEVKIEGDCLILTLQYGGGCREHQIDLALILPWCGTPPLPPPTFEIRHNANGDVCKALFTQNYSFDISGIREQGKTSVDFILHTKNSSGETASNTYSYHY